MEKKELQQLIKDVKKDYKDDNSTPWPKIHVKMSKLK